MLGFIRCPVRKETYMFMTECSYQLSVTLSKVMNHHHSSHHVGITRAGNKISPINTVLSWFYFLRYEGYWPQIIPPKPSGPEAFLSLTSHHWPIPHGLMVRTVNDRLNTTALISFSLLKVHRLFKSDAYLSVVIISTMGKTLKGIYKERVGRDLIS